MRLWIDTEVIVFLRFWIRVIFFVYELQSFTLGHMMIKRSTHDVQLKSGDGFAQSTLIRYYELLLNICEKIITIKQTVIRTHVLLIRFGVNKPRFELKLRSIGATQNK